MMKISGVCFPIPYFEYLFNNQNERVHKTNSIMEFNFIKQNQKLIANRMKYFY